MNKLISYSIFWGIVTLFSFFVIWGLVKGIKHMFDAPGNSILTASLIVGFIICWGVSFSFDPFNTVCGCAAGLAVGASGLLFYSLSFEKFFYAADNIVLFIGVTFIAFLLSSIFPILSCYFCIFHNPMKQNISIITTYILNIVFVSIILFTILVCYFLAMIKKQG